MAKLGSLSRFANPRQLMGYSGLVASEHTSGNKVHRGPITKSGNAHLRRVLVESSWSYHHRSNVTGFLLRRQKSLAISDEVKAIAWKAQHRLNKRYKTLAPKGNNKSQIVTAIARELLDFIWAIATHTEQGQAVKATQEHTNAFFPDSSAEGSVDSTKRRILVSFYAARATATARALSPRQLPTSHDPAVPTRVYSE